MSNVKLPWKQWLEVTAKEELRITNYPEGVFAPGPDFSLKKLPSQDLHTLVGDYIAAVEKGHDAAGATFLVETWTDGALEFTCMSTMTYRILTDEITMDDTNPQKGQIPLVTSTKGI